MNKFDIICTWLLSILAGVSMYLDKVDWGIYSAILIACVFLNDIAANIRKLSNTKIRRG